MARSRWIYINGEGIPADDYEALARARGHAQEDRRVLIAPDLPDFKSPIDGRVYSGRAGLREHCARHDVVPTADLKGLPPKPAHQVPVLTRAQREERKQQIARAYDAHR